jgi:hypothetical protein
MANDNCKRLKHNVQRLVIFIFSLLLIPSSEALAEYEKQGWKIHTRVGPKLIPKS